MKIYTISIDGRPIDVAYTTVVSIVREYGLPHRALLNAIRGGRYQVVKDGKYYLVVEVELKKGTRKKNIL